jgi:cobalt-zinc-cadmium efflux system protein
MGAGHSHPPAPAGHAGGRYRRKLAIAFGLIFTFFFVELVYGLIADSLALISDAGHMAADVVALGAALAATKIATRKDTTGKRTFGSYRAEVFASGLTVLIMLGVSAYVVFEALSRIGSDPEVSSTPMIIVGGLGLIINLLVMLMLRSGAAESLNVKGAYFEVVADTAGSVGVIAAGVLIATTGQPWWDTLVALAIGLFVAVRAIMLGRQVLAVLGQHVPDGMAIDEVAEKLVSIPGVTDVHDLHIWVLTSGMNVATAHLVGENIDDLPRILDDARTILKRDHHIEHATLQVERTAARECHEVDW